MRQSQLFAKTKKETPKDEESFNAKLLIKAGFIHKEMAGAYSFLPLGLNVMEKITGIIRQEMNSLGAQEIFLTSLQDSGIWEKSGRWSDKAVDIWFKTKLVNGKEVGLANTHEEPLTRLLQEYINSYRDLPCYIYQFQTKFRNELRAKGGLMRVREFIMKDLYSFSKNEKEFKEFYEKCADAYMRIFTEVGIGEHTFRTFASGGSFSKFSDEFQTVSAAGEDTIFVDRSKKIAINKEVYSDDALKDLGVKKSDLKEERAIEVGNIFPLGTKYSEPLGLTFKDEDGNVKPVIMGCYGIGLGRLMATIVEIFHDEKGIIWPKSVAPFPIHLISLKGGEKESDGLYKDLKERGIEILYDDREDKTAGEKFADADLIGLPERWVLSPKTLKEKCLEIKKRNEQKIKLIKISDVQSYLK